jgi:hypothetical protein
MMGRNANMGVYQWEVSTMLICFAAESAASDPSPLLLNAAIAIGSLAIGWFLKVLSDRMSEKALYDHRLRLEKEYGLYSDLWDKLFELRRAVGQLVEPLGSTSEVRHDEQTLDLFNAYQAVVRKGEPFMSTSVFGPARQIATLARKIIGNVGEQQSLHERRAMQLNIDTDEKLATEQVCLDEENGAAFKEIEELFQGVARAIRLRVSP